MEKLKPHPILWLCLAVCIMPCILAGQSLAECNMTTAGLDAAVGDCGPGDLQCYVKLAQASPECAAEIAWLYVMLNAPEDLNAVVNAFTAALPDSYTDALISSVDAAWRAKRDETAAGNLTTENPYPYGK